jgi:glucose/arabinose dehydrogenase
VDAGGERGLRALAFPPDHRRSRLLYTFSTDATGRIRIDEWRRAHPDRVDPASRRLVLDAPPAPAHNGGQLAFGPDGYLYAGLGDGAVLFQDGRPQSARDLSVVQGKILRIDPRRQPGGEPYAAPHTNPFFATEGADPAIWAFGLRNPFRFSFDRATGDLAVADVGEEAVEEVNLAPRRAGGGRGADFGWPCFEGSAPYSDPRVPPPCDAPGHVPPVLERPNGPGFGCAIVGGVVVRDRAVPSLRGRYLYADFCTGELRSARLRTPRAVDDRPLGLRRGAPSSFGEDACGRVHLTSLNGGLFRLAERARRKVARCTSA